MSYRSTGYVWNDIHVASFYSTCTVWYPCNRSTVHVQYDIHVPIVQTCATNVTVCHDFVLVESRTSCWIMSCPCAEMYSMLHYVMTLCRDVHHTTLCHDLVQSCTSCCMQYALTLCRLMHHATRYASVCHALLYHDAVCHSLVLTCASCYNNLSYSMSLHCTSCYSVSLPFSLSYSMYYLLHVYATVWHNLLQHDTVW